MSRVSLETDLNKYPYEVRKHLADSMDTRHFQFSMQQELKEWKKTPREVPDLAESPQGWYLEFSTFTIFGEGAYLKTVGTEYEKVNPRPAKGSLPKQVNLREWWGVRQEPPPRDFDDFMKRWKSYTPDERKEYMGLFPGRFKRQGSLDDIVAAFLDAPQTLDNDYKDLDPDPTSLDLP